MAPCAGPQQDRDGGFGSAVAEAMAESGIPARLARVGVPDRSCDEVGTREHLMAAMGMDAAAVAAAARRLVKDAEERARPLWRPQALPAAGRRRDSPPA